MDALLPVANVLGRLLSIFSFAYLMPIAAAIYYNDGTTADFVAMATRTTGRDLTAFFAAWLNRPELPGLPDQADGGRRAPSLSPGAVPIGPR